jgi:hypothetical protein
MLLSKSDTDSLQAEAWVAKAYDFAQLNNTLLQASKNIEAADEQILSLVCKWDKSNTVPQAKYPQSYDIKAFSELIDNTVKLQAARLGKVFDRYAKKKLVAACVDPRDSEELKEIQADIDNGGADAELPGVFGMSESFTKKNNEPGQENEPESNKEG